MQYQSQFLFVKRNAYKIEFACDSMDILLNSKFFESEIQHLICRQRMQQYKKESEALDQCSRLYDTASDNFDLDAKRIYQVSPVDVLYFCSLVMSFSLISIFSSSFFLAAVWLIWSSEHIHVGSSVIKDNRKSKAIFLGRNLWPMQKS